jgi:hypothetical protein
MVWLTQQAIGQNAFFLQGSRQAGGGKFGD